jgi:cell division inhibitor SepF
MANAMRKVAEYLGLLDGGEYTDEFGTYVDADLQEFEEQATVRTANSGAPYDRVSEPMQTSYAAPIRAAAPTRAAAPLGDVYRITTLHPITYNDARRIGEEFRSGSPVILNLSELDYADQVRVVDFSAGLVHGLQGTLEKVAKEVFLLSPANIDVSLAARAQLRDEPFFNQR